MTEKWNPTQDNVDDDSISDTCNPSWPRLMRLTRGQTAILLLLVLGTVAVLTLVRRELLLLPFTRKELAYYMLDATAGHLHRPNTERRTVWPEHADGSITARTNNLGFREDSATAEAKSGKFRILVTGDSQVGTAW